MTCGLEAGSNWLGFSFLGARAASLVVRRAHVVGAAPFPVPARPSCSPVGAAASGSTCSLIPHVDLMNVAFSCERCLPRRVLGQTRAARIVLYGEQLHRDGPMRV